MAQSQFDHVPNNLERLILILPMITFVFFLENVLPSTQSLTESKEDLMNPPRKISILKELEDRLERKSLGVYDDSFTNSLIKNSMEEEAINRSYLRALFTNSIQKSEAEAYRNSSRNYSTSNVPSPSTPYKNVRIKSLPTSNTFQKSHAIRHSLAVTDSPLLASSKKVSLSSPPGILKKNPQIKNSSSGGVHMVDSNESYHDNYGQSFSTRMENGGVEDTSKHCDAKADLCSQDDDDIDSFSPKFDFQELEKINGSDNDVFIPNKSEAAIITRDNNNSSSAYDLLDEDYLEVLDINAERLENCANTSTPPKPSFIAFKATPTSFSLGVNQCRMPPFASPRQKSLLTDQRIEIKTSNVMVVKVIERSSSEQSLNCEDIVVSSIGVDAPHIARESAKQLGAFPFLLVNPSTNLTMSHVDCIDVPDTSSSLNNAIVVTDPIKRNLKSSFQNSLTSQSSTQISTFTHINSFMLSSTLPKYTFSEMKEKPSILPKPKHLKSIMKKAEQPCEAKSESDDEKVSESISTPFPKTCAHNAFSKDYDVANEIPYVLHVRYIPNTQTISKAAIALANTLAISSTPSLNHKAYFISNSQLSNKILLDKSAQEKFLNCNLIKVEDLPSLLSCSSVDDSIVPSSKSLLSSKNGHKQQQQPHTLKKASPFFKSYSSGSLRTMASHLSFIDDEVDANNYFDNAFFRYNSLYDNDDIGIQVKACVKKAAEQNNNETTTEADGYSDITIC